MAIIAVPSIGEINGSNGDGSADFLRHWGVGETLFLRGDEGNAAGWLATGWELKSDLSGATIFIREGVPFQDAHGEFGDITATDVAWSMNSANFTTNPLSKHPHSGNFAAAWEEWRVTGEYEIEFDIVQLDFSWPNDILNQSGNSFTVVSKGAYETEGVEWAKENIVATGPFEIESWREDDHLTLVSRYADGGQHYLTELTPKTNSIQFIHTPDASLRFTLMKLGSVDAALVEPLDGAWLVGQGFSSTGTDYDVQLGVFFSGNLWEETHAVSGEALPTEGAYIFDIPWIGEPGEDDDMEQARLVRRALTLAIDRDEINEELLGGLGVPVHVTYFSTSAPNWDSKWEYSTDIDEAIDILQNQIEGDYFEGSGVNPSFLGDNAFEINISVGLELGGPDNLMGDIGDAIGAAWSQLGLTVGVSKDSRDPVRDFLPQRMLTIPRLSSCEIGRESLPWSAPKGLLQTSLTRGGFGCVIESPELLDFYRRMATAEDNAAASQAATEYLDYVHYWNLQPGVIAVPFDVFYNPNKISSWPMPKSQSSPIDAVWNLELK